MQWRQLNHRPKGITIIAILQILGGIGSISNGVFLIGGGGSYSGNSGYLGAYGLALGVFYLFVGYGLYSGKGWAWTTSVLAQIVGVPLGLVVGLAAGQGVAILAGSIPSIILAIIILSYMFRPTTKAYFGKAQLTA